MKIFYIINTVTVGGAENQMGFVIKAIHEKYPVAKISVISLMEPATGMVADLKPYTDNIYNLGLKQNGGVINFTSAFVKLLKILKENKPDVVHSFLFHSNVMARFARLFVKIPVLFNATFDDAKGSKLRLNLIKYTDFLIDYFTIDNVKGWDNYVASKVMKQHKSSYLSNGINVKEEQHADSEVIDLLKSKINYRDGDFVWLNIARLTEQKDHKNLINAVSILLKTNSAFKIAVVGDGELYEELKQEIKQKKLESIIFLLGRRNDINNLFRFANGFIISSAWEGMPIVVMQAMNAGMTILSTNVGALPILIEDGKNGFLVAKRDSNALAEGMKHLMALPYSDREEIGLNAKFKIQNEFNIEHTVTELMNLYREKGKTKN